MTDKKKVWRNEERTSVEEVSRAVAGSSIDGQGDDVTANDAGEESAFGHGPEAVDRDGQAAGAGREPTDPDRAYRPSTTGRTGPDTL
ncbi:hypothetical protein D7147_23670 [Micromonospora musae]|uniref:Uncharacterized protein n=1 Tax=Micromonospora musae TaxID=1894970 RepID=A0A3A9YDU6_9ACTN|nr:MULTISPECIES: hypothetical protein [Micromonospora]RKN16096.1 hypothetical protein D7147_23670 [Micromonospora musae]RKN35338.1 hypothetical protein D7044_03955 [Micromonospora musae]TYC02394.1 hypothetical protein FXF53_10060 [Micromonospora sp. WP24]